MWDIILALCGVQWVFPNSIKEVLSSWKGSFVGKKGKKCGNPSRFSFFGQYGRRGIG